MKHHSGKLGVDGLRGAWVEKRFGLIVLSPIGEDWKLKAAFDGEEVAL